MGSQSQVTGPDLTAGVSVDELGEGKPLVGHVGEQAVMLVRRGDTVHAVGATCTHYSGPLGEGAIVGDTVRCPWHHACFDLATGEAVRAPALNPIPCFDVVREGGRVRVGGQRPQPVATPPAGAGEVARVVIVGGGAAGHAAAEQLRRRGYRGAITMLSADAAGPVDRPNLSKDYLAGSAPEEWIPLRPPEWFSEHDITLELDARVTALDLTRREAVLADGQRRPWDRLLLATGARPRRLTLPGADASHIHYLRTLADSRALIAAAAGSKRAVVVGSSFIGLEAAAALRTRGLEVHVVAPEPRPLGHVLGRALGDFIRGLHEEHGVVFHLERTPVAIGDGVVRLSDGSEVAADLVVVGIGVVPETALAEAAGLAVEHGVVVDEHLETSAPGVYAAGDIARWPDAHGGSLRVEHWVVAQRQGQTAARNLLGARERFDAVPFFWSAHYDVSINYVGHAPTWDREEVEGDPKARDCAVRFYVGARLAAVATLFRDGESLEAERALEAAR